jgi:hypothetical protein
MRRSVFASFCLVSFALAACGPMELSPDAGPRVDAGQLVASPMDAGTMTPDAGTMDSLAGAWRLVGTWKLENQQALRSTHQVTATVTGNAVRFEVGGFCTLRATRQGSTITLDADQQCTVPSGAMFPIQPEMMPGVFAMQMPFTAPYCYGVSLTSAQPATLTATGFTATGTGAADSQCQTRATRPCALTFEFTRQ